MSEDQYRRQRQNEYKRRVPVRLATSALINVVGPASAWTIGGNLGLLIYIAVYIFSKYFAAKVSSLSNKGTILAYRCSALLLVFGGFAPFAEDIIGNGFFISSAIVPFLLGSYEGFFWNGYWDICDNHLAKNGWPDKDERKKELKKQLEIFQKYEVLCAVAGAMLAVVMAEFASKIPIQNAGGLTASLIALISFIIPWNKDIIQINDVQLGRKVSDLGLNYAKLISQPYAVVQFITVQGMRFAALEYGGISALGMLVAVSELVGWLFVLFLKRNEEEEEEEEEDEFSKSNLRIWNLGFLFVISGLLGMICGLIIDDFIFVTVGYLIAQCAIRGILRPYEIKFAKDVLKRESENDSPSYIGIRERLKFKSHIYAVILLVSLWNILDLYDMMELFVPALLTLGILCSVLALSLFSNEKRIQKFSGTSS